MLPAGSSSALCVLPADPAVPLPAFAARVLGSAHALDAGHPGAIAGGCELSSRRTSR
ncbi:hypothetical protein J7E97_12765 [Streptomyces sp. ISL-66]|uniref:TIGR02679 domain-containing protein n=1 Tax=Streptomyces sp. ISL-66 TaxID=2819186 RepID=UPI001BEB1628|nr:TIGR02679 domain-containing protein [Streptomyces sp. ISL-66]MBT2468725.1 hypothetical protein [Streptomyces sp. ISL-66]